MTLNIHLLQVKPGGADRHPRRVEYSLSSERTNREHVRSSSNAETIVDERRLDSFEEVNETEQVALLQKLPSAVTVAERHSCGTTGGLRGVQALPTNDDWNDHRQTITRLYKEEDRTLADVIQIMRTQHGFTATKKMYKTRLAAWNVRKYMTWEEREAASQLFLLMKSTGRTPRKIIVGDKERNPDVLVRHMGQSSTEFRQEQISRANLPSDVDIVINSSQSGLLDLRIRYPMYPGGPERPAEMVCKETSEMALNMPGCPISTTMRSFLAAAGEQSQDGDVQSSRVLLDKAADWFYNNLKASPARALLSLLRSQHTVQSYRPGHSDLFVAFYRHLLDLTRALHGPHHTIAQVAGLIMWLRRDPMAMEVIYQSTLTEALAKTLEHGRSGSSEWQAYLNEARATQGQERQGTRILRLHTDDTTRGLRSSYTVKPRYIECQFETTLQYMQYAAERDVEEEFNLLEIAQHGSNGNSGLSQPNSYNVYYASCGLGRLAQQRHDFDAAVEHYKRRLQAAVDLWGESDTDTLRTADSLANLLRDEGREREANEVERSFGLGMGRVCFRHAERRWPDEAL